MSCFGFGILKKNSSFGKNITNMPPTSHRMVVLGQKEVLLPKTQNSMCSVKERELIQKSEDPKGGEASEYRQQIFEYFIYSQQKFQAQLVGPITKYMRQILIDWLIQLQQYFKLNQQTLYLALAYLNVTEANHEISLQQYQLIGSACLWMASKYEQINPPPLAKFCEATKHSYHEKQFITAEATILNALNFNLNIVTPIQMLQFVSNRLVGKLQKIGPRQKKRIISCWKYIMQIAILQDIGKQFCMFTLVIGSFQATLAKLYPAMTRKQPFEVKEEFLTSCILRINQALLNYPRNHLKSLTKKFSKDKYAFIAKLIHKQIKKPSYHEVKI